MNSNHRKTTFSPPISARIEKQSGRNKAHKKPRFARFKHFCGDNITRIALVLFTALFWGCKTPEIQPEWVMNPQSIYPENSYLVAVGSGTSRHVAEQAADANLSRIFRAQIQATEHLVDRVSETEETFERTSEMQSSINILSQETLINIQHAEMWQDEKGTFHAVAYLNRHDTSAIYQDRIQANQKQMQAFLKNADLNADPLRQYAWLRAARRIAVDNTTLLRQQKVINPSLAANKSGDLKQVIQKALADASAKVTVQFAHSTESAATPMEDILSKWITQYGFTGSQKEPNLIIEGEATITKLQKETAGLLFFRYKVALKIMDQQHNLLATVSESGREAVTTDEQARERCWRTIENTVLNKGTQALDHYFDSLAASEK